MTQFDFGANVPGGYFKQHGIDRNGGIVFNGSYVGVVKEKLEFMLRNPANGGLFGAVEITV